VDIFVENEVLFNNIKFILCYEYSGISNQNMLTGGFQWRVYLLLCFLLVSEWHWGTSPSSFLRNQKSKA